MPEKRPGPATMQSLSHYSIANLKRKQFAWMLEPALAAKKQQDVAGWRIVAGRYHCSLKAAINPLINTFGVRH